MKKIFYSLMAAALCACAQSEVEDVVTPPQSENGGLKFEVVDNGYLNENGTRVTYGEYGTPDAYKATFGEGDAIGVYAIKSSDMANDGTPDAYVVENAKLTLTNGVWKGSVDFQDADLLFAYAPYRANVNLGDGKPLFTGAQGSWAVSTGNNRFFVHPYLTLDNSTKELFDAADWMGAAVNLTGNETTITFNMQHMRGMVELTTDKNVELTDLKLAIGGDNGAQYTFKPYHVNAADNARTKNVYRILTTEYRSQNTVYATIQDLNIVKKYKKTLSAESVGAGKCALVNIGYAPAPVITVSADKSLAATLTELYGDDYATDPALTTLRLAGELQEADWATLQSLTKLTSLDMYQLTNKSIPANWMKNAATLRDALTTLVLPNTLETIGGDALQFDAAKKISLELPTSVTTIGNGAFYNNQNMSICIPENSNLQTIGQGAFLNVGTIYTDPASVNVLKIPASVTKIDGAAFGGAGLTKVIFQSENAPEIVNGAYAVTFNTAVKVYVPNSANYKDKGLFPGMTVFVGPGLTAENYYTPYTFSGGWTDGIGLAGLCDGVTGVGGKHWHSKYSGTYDEWGIYIDITLPTKETGYNPLTVSYTTRSENGNGAPTKVRMAVSNDGETYTAVGEDFATSTLPGGNETITFGPITVGTNKYVRFAILEAKGVSVVGETGQSANLAELTVYEETWTE